MALSIVLGIQAAYLLPSHSKSGKDCNFDNRRIRVVYVFKFVAEFNQVQLQVQLTIPAQIILNSMITASHSAYSFFEKSHFTSCTELASGRHSKAPSPS
jgi:hypothetical protein